MTERSDSTYPIAVPENEMFTGMWPRLPSREMPERVIVAALR